MAEAEEALDLKLAQRLARAKQGIKDEHGARIPLCGQLKALGRAGVGVELYFRTLRMSAVAFAAAGALGCISLANNLQHNEKANGALEPLMRSTIGPCCRADERELTDLQGLPWFGTFFIFVVLIYLLRYKQRSVAKEVDERFITTDDYSVELRELPLDGREEEIVEFCEQFGQVAQCAVGYCCSEYVRNFARWKKADIDLRETRAKMAEDAAEAAAGKRDGARGARLAAKLEGARGEMLALEAEMARLQAEELVASGAAFVVFETEAGRRACLRGHNLSWWEAFLEALGYLKMPRFRGRFRLEATPAPAPSDVYWENLEVGQGEVRKRALLTLVVAAGLIGVSGALLGVVTTLKNDEVRRFEERQVTAASAQAYKQGLAVTAAAVVTAVNSLLRVAVTHLTVYERRDTRTQFEQSLFVKLSIAYVANQSLLILFVSPDPDSWFVDGGVYQQARAA